MLSSSSSSSREYVPMPCLHLMLCKYAMGSSSLLSTLCIPARMACVVEATLRSSGSASATVDHNDTVQLAAMIAGTGRLLTGVSY